MKEKDYLSEVQSARHSRNKKMWSLVAGGTNGFAAEMMRTKAHFKKTPFIGKQILATFAMFISGAAEATLPMVDGGGVEANLSQNSSAENKGAIGRAVTGFTNCLKNFAWLYAVPISRYYGGETRFEKRIAEEHAKRGGAAVGAFTSLPQFLMAGGKEILMGSTAHIVVGDFVGAALGVGGYGLMTANKTHQIHAMRRDEDVLDPLFKESADNRRAIMSAIEELYKRNEQTITRKDARVMYHQCDIDKREREVLTARCDTIKALFEERDEIYARGKDLVSASCAFDNATYRGRFCTLTFKYLPGIFLAARGVTFTASGAVLAVNLAFSEASTPAGMAAGAAAGLAFVWAGVTFASSGIQDLEVNTRSVSALKEKTGKAVEKTLKGLSLATQKLTQNVQKTARFIEEKKKWLPPSVVLRTQKSFPLTEEDRRSSLGAGVGTPGRKPPGFEEEDVMKKRAPKTPGL